MCEKAPLLTAVLKAASSHLLVKQRSNSVDEDQPVAACLGASSYRIYIYIIIII